jgi:DNA-binding IclR family transcriptional regulator
MDRELVYIDKREGSGMIRISSDIGWRRPLHYGMLGMVLMAYLPPDEVNEILEKYPLEAHTKNSITDRHAFFLRLEKIRNDGYVIESEEAVEGVLGIAAPIRDYSRQVVASMGVALPKTQANTESQIQNNADLVKKTCDEISSNLGYLKI